MFNLHALYVGGNGAYFKTVFLPTVTGFPKTLAEFWSRPQMIRQSTGPWGWEALHCGRKVARQAVMGCETLSQAKLNDFVFSL